MGENISIKVKEKAHELGYELCGIIEANSFAEYTEYLNLRVEKFPKSVDLYKGLYGLGEPLKKAEWGKSIIVCIRRYNKYKLPQNLVRYFGKVYLFDGRLSCSREYRNKALFKEYLESMGMKTHEDGVTARWAAAKAGLGRFRKNNFIYTKFGSFVWIDTWIVDREFEYDTETNELPNCPENCRRCIDACPTKALSEEYAMDRKLCIAQLSFYSTELPTKDIREKMGTWVYGCDVCQDVCPMNRNTWTEEEDFPDLESIKDCCSLEQILTMDNNTFLNIIDPRFWYTGKDKLWLWKCNAIRAMVNSGEDRYNQLIKDACSDKDDRIHAMAVWACEQLGIDL